MAKAEKDGWDKARVLAHILATIAIPIVIGLLGFWIQSAVKDREIKRDYVELATGILSAKGNNEALREWAVALLSEHSPVPITDDVRTALLDGNARLSLALSRDFHFDDALANAFSEMAKRGQGFRPIGKDETAETEK